jgi:hypothetical protein
VIVIRDPGSKDDGTVFKPDLKANPNYVNDKFSWNESIFKPEQLADGPLPAPAESLPPPEAPAPVRPAPNEGGGGGPGSLMPGADDGIGVGGCGGGMGGGAWKPFPGVEPDL